MLFPVNMCFAVGMRTSGVVLGIALPFVADALAKDVLDTAVDPSAVAHQKFDLERRGFDQAQVRAYLIAVGDALTMSPSEFIGLSAATTITPGSAPMAPTKRT